MEGSSNTNSDEGEIDLTRFLELVKIIEDQTDDSSASSSTQNQPPRPVGPEQSALPDPQFPIQFTQNSTIRALPRFSYASSWGPNRQRFFPGNFAHAASSSSTSSSSWINQYAEEARINFELGSSRRQNMNLHRPALAPQEYSLMDPGALRLHQIIQLALSFDGSLWLQNVLAEKKAGFTSIIFEGLIEHIVTLAVDPSGYNVLVSLIQTSDADQASQIVRKLIQPPTTLIGISLDPIGSKLVQRLIQVLKKSDLVDHFMAALAVGFYELMTNHHGGLVMSRCLFVLNSAKSEKLYAAAVHDCLALAKHAKGCINLNAFITAISGPYREQLLHKITDHTVFLSQDPRGNFVVQHILELHDPVFTRKICDLLQGYYGRLCVQKSGSHIVEKCLRSPGMKVAVLDLIKSGRLAQIAHDQFGNYVIQTALKVTKSCDRALHAFLLDQLQPCMANLACHLHGKNVHKLIVNGVPDIAS